MYYKSPYSIAFREWLETPLGRKFCELESNVVNSMLPTMFGYNAVILSEPSFATFLQQGNIKHKALVNYSLDGLQVELPIPAVIARQDKLPLGTEMVDLVYLAHCLEFTNNPHEVLRETHRILRPDGHVIISIFNPFSAWGLWGSVARIRSKAPWRANFMGLVKIKDWLALLGFDIMRVNHFGYCLPFKISNAPAKMSCLEKYGQRIGIPCGAAYVIEASKRIIPVTPIRPVWLTEREVVAHDDAAEPTV